MAKLALSPQISSIVIDDSADMWSSIELEGGLPRTYRNFLDPDSYVSCEWRCKPDEYSYLRNFYIANRSKNFESFNLDLILDGSSPIEQTVKFVPGSLRLLEQRGYLYRVSATIVVDILRNPSSWPQSSAQSSVIYPQAVTSFAVFAGDGVCELFWYNPEYIIEIRSGSNWDSGSLVYKGFASSFNIGRPANGTHSYTAKFVDNHGRYSLNAVTVTFTVAGSIVTGAASKWHAINGSYAQWMAESSDPNDEFELTTKVGATWYPIGPVNMDV